MGGDREETRRPPGLRHAPRHQSLSSWAAIERRHGGRLACAMPQGINRWGVGAVLGAAASSSEPGGQARGQASTVASGGGGAGTGRDEERGHDRTPERAGLGASSMFITLTSSPFVLAAEPQGRSTRLGNFGGDGEKYGVEKIKIRCSRGIPPRRRSAPRFLISVRAPALVSPRPLASISGCWSSSRRRSGRCSSSPTAAAIVLFDFCPKLYRPPLRFLPDCRSRLHLTSPVDPP
jgi:hypothetical protein